RWLYNARVALAPPIADVTVGVDLDGFLWARRRRGPFVVMLKGIIADELRNERGLVRALLSLQARWERANTARADRVVVPSRYSASVARDAYGIPEDKLAVVPEPIDLDEWRRRFAEAATASAARPTVLSVARMYPRKRLEDLLLATALETLLMNESLRREFGRAATRRVEAYGLERVARRFLETLP